jgi:hypothetical protein
MPDKFYLVKDGPPNPGEYMTAPGYFRASHQPEKLTQASMAAVGNRDYTTDKTYAYAVTLPNSTSPKHQKALDALCALSTVHACRLERCKN